MSSSLTMENFCTDQESNDDESIVMEHQQNLDSPQDEEFSCSRCSSPADPLAPLSDYAGESSGGSSWGSEESLSYGSISTRNFASPLSTSTSCINYETGWKRRYTRLREEMIKYRRHTHQMRDLLQEKLTDLELRVAEAETRAEEAEDKVRLMEERLQQSSEQVATSEQSSNEVEREQNNEATAITKLASQVEEQRQLRLQDAKLVEAKAARIKEWVTNKLRDLEAQNQHLREQNHKCNQQLELLRKHMAQLSAGRMAESSVTDSALSSATRPTSFPRANSVEVTPSNVENREPVYAQVDRQSKKHNNSNESLTHRRYYLSVGTSSSMDDSVQPSSSHDPIDIHSLATLPSHARPRSACMVVESDVSHDYAEIYTPNREKIDWETNGKPPTPPLHRFPSWESRIYQVANEGLSNALPDHMDKHFRNTARAGPYPTSSGYCDISCPVYATVKGRASQIRSSPFSGDSSDDSSDGEDHHIHTVVNSRTTNSSTENTDTSISSSSPSKSQSQKTGSSLSPLKRSSSGSPSKCELPNAHLHTSFESGISDDYAIPPDAVSCGGESIDWSTIATSPGLNHHKFNVNELCFDKCGNLAKLGGKLKTWRKRWFHLNASGLLRYWKSQGDTNRKPRGELFIDEVCRITRADGAATFEISTPKKTFYLTADSISAMEDWLRVLQNVQRRNATKVLLSKENYKPTIQGWLTKVRNGHSKKCWCLLIGKVFLYFKSPSENNPVGQINMREARVEQVEHVSDSDSDEKETDLIHKFTIGVFPISQPPTYLLMPSKQEMDSWLYHLTVVASGNPNVGTQYEQLIQKLMETDGESNNVLWKHPQLLHTKETITSTLTTLPSETLVLEALKLFKSCQLFMSVAVESAGIDYHVVLAQNALQQCLDNWQLQAELLCALIKQTSPHVAHKLGVQVLSKLRHRQLLLCASQSLFACDTVGSPTVAHVPPISPTAISNIDQCKSNPPTFVFLQGWQLLALAVSLFVPKDYKILWYLKCHLRRNSDTKTECGKYAAYCERALERTIQNGNREMKPSRMEVLSILLKNPYHHSLPHSIPVHFLNGTYQVVGFDGSTTVKEFLKSLTQDIVCRDYTISGFMLFSDDPIEKDLEHYIDPQTKLCDVISKWETVLREKGSGKFENTKVIQLVYKNRLYFKQSAKTETDREKILMCYQTNYQIVNGRFPLTRELALELAALMAQIDFGEFSSEKSRGSGGVGGYGTGSTGNSKDLVILQAVDKFYPYRYRDGLSPEALKELQATLQEKWLSLKGRSSLDCIRIYLTCTRKWPFFGANLFQAKWKQGGDTNNLSSTAMIWLAASEEGISLLELSSMQVVASYPYLQVLTFGGCQDDFMLVINRDDEMRSQKLLFALSKPKILELTLIIADYMNALGQVGTPVAGTLNHNNIQPDILKATPDHQLNRVDSKRYHFES